MKDYTILITYFEELEKFAYSTTEFTFNGFAINSFKDYRQNLKNQYIDFNNNFDTFILDNLSADKFMIISSILNDRINNTLKRTNIRYNEFTDKLNFTVVKTTVIDIDSIKSNIPPKATSMQKLVDIIHSHINIIELSCKLVQSRFDIIKSVNAQVFNSISTDTPITQHHSSEPTITSKPVIGTFSTNNDKLTMYLSKNEVAMFFIFLYNNNIIKPADRQELYSFIENNFRYIDNSTGKRSISDIIDVNGTFSKITNGDVEDKYNKQKDKKATKYQVLINDFFEDFKKYKLYKFRDAF